MLLTAHALLWIGRRTHIASTIIFEGYTPSPTLCYAAKFKGMA
jgi:hypothetical protein